MSSQKLAKRTAKRAKAEAELKVATEADDKNDVDKFSKRLVRVTRDHNEDCKTLLSLMGVPVITVSAAVHNVRNCKYDLFMSAKWACALSLLSAISPNIIMRLPFSASLHDAMTGGWQAPSEAEAQCAALAREGAVYGTATEDMDALTFQTPKLLRRMTFSGSNQPILEVDYQKLLRVSDRTVRVWCTRSAVVLSVTSSAIRFVFSRWFCILRQLHDPRLYNCLSLA